MSLRTELDRLVDAFARLPASARPELRPPRPAAEIDAALRTPAFRRWPAEALAELRAWFSLHDGQDDTSRAPNPDDNYLVHSLDGAIEAGVMIRRDSDVPPAKELAPYLPVLYNGSGDHVIYVARTRSLASWYHDSDDSGDVVAASLAAWCATTSAAIEAALPIIVERARDAERRTAASAARVATPRPAAWIEVEPFTALDLAAPGTLAAHELVKRRAQLDQLLRAAPPGTVFRIDDAPIAGVPPACRLVVKHGDDAWLVASARDLEAARDALPVGAFAIRKAVRAQRDAVAMFLDPYKRAESYARGRWALEKR